MQTEPVRAPFAVILNRVSELRSQGGFGLGDNGRKPGLVMHGHIGQNFPIELDRCFFRSGDKHTVRHTEFAAGRVDAGNPESAERTLLVAAIAVGILPRFHYRLFGDAKDITAATAIAFGCFDNFFVTGAGGNAAFYAWHSGSPVIKRKASLP